MGVTFVIITVGERVKELVALLKSIGNQRRFDDYDINIMFQGTKKQYEKLLNYTRFHNVDDKGYIANVFYEPKRLGCHTARLRLLKLIKYDAYINLDDDMLLVNQTDYSSPLQKIKEKDCGFVLTNWARSQKILDIKIPKLKSIYKKQILCYNGGGMAYNNTIANLMRTLPEVPTKFDNAWSLTTYINGYTNYAYKGSVALHFVLRSDGMQQFNRENPIELMCSEFINFVPKIRKTVLGETNYKIPADVDVNQIARNLHKTNKK